MGFELTDDRKQSFNDLGYLIFEPLLTDVEIAELKAAVDELVEWRAQDPSTRRDMKFVFEIPALGELARHPKIMAIVEGVMGPDFALHHIHAVRQEAGTPGVNWHQDYRQIPHTNRSHVMVHVFCYLSGLDGQVGDLLILPRSQKSIGDNSTTGQFRQHDLPGSITVDNVAPGTVIVVHSALWHARRAKPGGEGKPRYFANSAYCQAGIRWPGYPDYTECVARAEAKGLTTGERAHLFNADMFFDPVHAQQMLKQVEGSLATQLAGWVEAQ